MTKYFLIFLILCSLVSAAELAVATEPKPTYPVVFLFSGDGSVLLVIHLTPYQPGDWDKAWFQFECKTYRMTQRTFAEFLYQNWLSGNFDLDVFNLLSKHWRATPTTYQHMGLTTTEYIRWVNTGELIKDADYAVRLAEEEAKRKEEEAARLAEAYAELAKLMYYTSLADKYFHQTKDCVDCAADCYEIQAISVMTNNMEEDRKYACPKCFEVQ